MSSTHVAFITGIGSGIGRATALQLASSHSIIGVDRDPASLAQTTRLIEAAGGRAVGYEADVTNYSSLLNAVAQGEEKYGTINAAVSCAGIESSGNIVSTSLELWQRTLDINTTGVFLTAKAVIESLLKTKGSFTAVASDAGTQGAQDYAAYVASKHAVIGLIRCMALDHAPDGVRSNVICPGFVETPMARRLFRDDLAQENFYRKSVPLGRFALPEEIAATVQHFVNATYANGTIYAIDGGSTAGYFAAQ